VIISAADQADIAVGVPLITVTAAYYFWAQRRGFCAVLQDEAITRGKAVTIGSSTPGAVEMLDAAGEPQIGVMIDAGVDGEYSPTYLQLE
jgi:hypothetical protein